MREVEALAMLLPLGYAGLAQVRGAESGLLWYLHRLRQRD